jgi:hypothetical protein
MAAWHWNENGTWSDPAHNSGYFTGSTDLKAPIRYILSYALPHRGFSTSGDRPLQGPNLSYWKSNPYLTIKFTGESDALHPQWVVVDLNTFEHYPFDPCTITWKTLYGEPQLMTHILQVWRNDGVPNDLPLMVTEDHLANELTGPMTTIFAALWLADNVGSFFEGGGAAFYHSPIQPQGIQNSCLGWASWSNFVSDEDYDIKGYTSPYLRGSHD